MAQLIARSLVGSVCIAILLTASDVRAWKNGPASNKVTNSLADCQNPPYSTHDWIADHARGLLPEQERAWLDPHRKAYLIGTEAPDYDKIKSACGTPNRGYNDTGKGRHDLRFNTNGNVTRDTPARRAQEEYDKAVKAYRAGNLNAAAYYLGAAAHYPADLGQYGHTIKGERHHHDYEEWAHDLTDTHGDDTFESTIKSDGFDRRSAYGAVVWIGRHVHEGGGKILPARLMDDLWDEKDQTYMDSVSASLNKAVNGIADMLHTFYLDVVIDTR